MSPLRARLHRFRLELDPPLSTAHGLVGERRGVVVELRDEEGRRGFGEAAPLPGFHAEDIAECEAELVRCLASREGAKLPSAAFALECAALDLEAQRLGLPLAELLRRGTPGPARSRVPVNSLISGVGAAALAECAARARASGFDTHKLKVGLGTLDSDLERVRALRAAVGPDAAIRLDANGAWSESEASAALLALAEFDPEWVEQPVAATELAAMARLRRESGVPIAADESLRGEDAAAQLLAERAADVFVLKPSVCGGLRAAMRIARIACGQGLRTVVTTLLDSALGRVAALHLAAALPGELPACGLATGDRMRVDLAEAPPIRGGEQSLPRGAGLGARPEPSRLREIQGWQRVEARAWI